MIADLPSKEELVSKLLFLLQYPVSSLARTLKAIADK
jgi:ribosomal protein L10